MMTICSTRISDDDFYAMSLEICWQLSDDVVLWVFFGSTTIIFFRRLKAKALEHVIQATQATY